MFNFFKKTPIGKTGDLVKSPEDNRDFLLSSYIPSVKRIPEKYPPLFDLDVLDQKQEPSCVGYALACMKQFNEMRERVYRVFDGSWIYRKAKGIDGMPNFPGTYLRAGLSVVKNIGAKTGSEDPSIYRIESYARVDDMSFEGLKKAIALYGTVLAGFRGSNQGWQQEVVRPPKTNETQWSHAVALIGYEKNYLIGQNSWGETSHNKGLFKVPVGYLPFEAWVKILDRPNEPSKIETGWVAFQYLKDNTTTANLNVREQPTTSAKILKVLPKGTKVELFGSANKFANGFTWTEILI
jgi:hypothetical protein